MIFQHLVDPDYLVRCNVVNTIVLRIVNIVGTIFCRLNVNDSMTAIGTCQVCHHYPGLTQVDLV